MRRAELAFHGCPLPFWKEIVSRIQKNFFKKIIAFKIQIYTKYTFLPFYPNFVSFLSIL